MSIICSLSLLTHHTQFFAIDTHSLKITLSQLYSPIATFSLFIEVDGTLTDRER
jgi:hypothetical protein